MTVPSEDYKSQIIDSNNGKPFASGEDGHQVELHGTSIVMCWRLRVNWFMMLEQLAQYWLLDLYSQIHDKKLGTIGQLTDQIMMGQLRQKWQRCSDRVEDVIEEEEWHNAGYMDEPKKESYLPDSVHRSSCHMAALAKNTLMLVLGYGCPHVFIMLTYNPQWPEILSQLMNGQSAYDHPDETVPVFKSRLEQIKTNIRHGKYFQSREVVYLFHVIGYQYHGLPHAHMVTV